MNKALLKPGMFFTLSAILLVIGFLLLSNNRESRTEQHDQPESWSPDPDSEQIVSDHHTGLSPTSPEDKTKQPDLAPKTGRHQPPTNAMDAKLSDEPGNTPEKSGYKLKHSDNKRLTLAFSTGRFHLSREQHQGRDYIRVHHARKTGVTRNRGYPEVPTFRTDLHLPENGSTSVRLVSSSFEERHIDSPIPSPGFVKRAPAERPNLKPGFTSIYPQKTVRLTHPYRIRQHRGAGLIIYPFQYDPTRNVLRVYTELEISIEFENSLTKTEQAPDAIINSFDLFAARRFINTSFRSPTTDQTVGTDESTRTGSDERDLPPATEPANLLIIYPDDWDAALETFVTWKRERGLVVSTASYPTETGSGSTALEDFITTKYDDQNITHILLVGDAGDIPVAATSPNPSDTLYTLLSGADNYHDAFISRIAAGTALHASYQLDRIVMYEQATFNAMNNDWLSQALFVASDEGSDVSAFTKDDKEILDEERDALLSATTTQIDRIYAPGADRDDVTNTLNSGRGLVYYLGHGSETAWLTTGFNTYDAYQLDNGEMWPLIMNGNCTNGNFTRSNGDCLAEAFMKGQTTSSSTGAISVIAATTDMDWDPPIVMMRDFTDYWTGAQTAFTLGGFTFHALQTAMDYCYETPSEGAIAAELIMEQLHIIGDCTLGLRTHSPKTLDVSAPNAIVGDQPFEVEVLNAATDEPLLNANVCLYRASDHKQFVTRTDVSGMATLSPPVLDGNEMTLTVYERNSIPFQADLPIRNELTITTKSHLPPVFVNDAFDLQLAAVAGNEPYEWKLFGTSTPNWVTIGTNGSLTGTPTETGTYTFSVTVTDQDNTTAEQTFDLTVGRPVAFVPTTPANGEVLTDYSHTFDTTGIHPPHAITLSNGTLPPGLTLSDTGTLSGVPEAAGNYDFALTASDTIGNTDTFATSLSITASDTLAIQNDTSLPKASRNNWYTTTFSAIGGAGEGYHWEIEAGYLPPGLELNANGVMSGTPQTSGDFTFTLRATDQTDATIQDTADFTITIDSPAWIPAQRLPGAYTSIPYETQLTAEGTATPLIWSESLGLLRETNSFANTGTLKNTWNDDETEWPLSLGFSFPYFDHVYTECRVSDNGYIVFGAQSPDPKWEANTDNFVNNVMIAPFWNDLIISNDHPGTGIFVSQDTDSITIRWRGVDYHNEEDVLNFSVTLESNGHIRFSYGNISTTNRVVIGLSDGYGSKHNIIATHSYDDASPDYFEGWDYATDVFYAPSERLPPWLSISTDGKLTGTPSQSGTETFQLQVTDSNGEHHTRTFELSVSDGADNDHDSTISNTELLRYLTLYERGQISLTAAEAAAVAWQDQRTPNNRGNKSGTTLPVHKPRTGTIIVATVNHASLSAPLKWLTENGFDVASATPDTFTVYMTLEEHLALKEAGWDVEIAAFQSVGSIAETRDAQRTVNYHTPDTLSNTLHYLAETYPDLCRLYEIGTSVEGRTIWALKITDQPQISETEPELQFCGSIHGDEQMSGEMCIRLADLLLSSYGQSERITSLVDHTEIWLMPMLNPDGVAAHTRYNANGIDLNRDFPDAFRLETGTIFPHATVLNTQNREPETEAVMTWSGQRAINLSAVFHTGALVSVYPYGNTVNGDSVYAATPDDALFRHYASTYAQTHPTMSPSTSFTDGITNGAAWYAVAGEVADWMYRFNGSFALTIEISKTKSPTASDISNYWSDNQEAMLALAETAREGLYGRVLDEADSTPLWARVSIAGNEHPTFTDRLHGDYHRNLHGEDSDITFSAPGYLSRTLANPQPFEGKRLRRDILLTSARTYADRKFDTPIIVPNQHNNVSLKLNGLSQTTDNAIIVSETIPAGWQLAEGTVQLNTGRKPDFTQVDGRTCHWLFWPTPTDATHLNYSITPPTDASSLTTAQFDGSVQTVTGHVLTTGSSLLTNQLPSNSFILELSKGWNLFSIPVKPDKRDPSMLFAEATPYVLNWEKNFYKQVFELNPKKAYWYHLPEAYQFFVRGSKVQNYEYTLNPGWNLIGPVGQTPVDLRGHTAWYWQEHSYHQATVMVPGKGYWLFSAETQVLDLTPR